MEKFFILYIILGDQISSNPYIIFYDPFGMAQDHIGIGVKVVKSEWCDTIAIGKMKLNLRIYDGG